MYFAYVLYSSKIKRYYYGSTKNIEKRLIHHNLGLNRWSKRGIPWILVYKELYNTHKETLAREKFFKFGKGREFIRDKITELVSPQADPKMTNE